MKTVAFMVALLIAALAFGEEPSNVAEPYVGIEVIGYKKVKDNPDNRHVSIQRKGDKIIVFIRDLFMCDGPLEKPYIMDTLEKKATLNVGVERPKLFGSGCQDMMELTIGIKRPWLEKGTTLYIYNKDDAMVLGHLIVP